MSTIIFDFDGTLADTQKTIFRTVQATLKALDMPAVSPDDIRPLIGLPLRETFVRLTGVDDEACFDRCVDTYRELFEEIADKSVALFPHVEETLRTLHRNGVVLTVASSRGRASLCSLTQKLGIDSLFSLILGEDDVINKKPAPDMVLETMRRLGSSPEDTWMVGDTTYDIAMGQAAGCGTIGVSYGNHSQEQMLLQRPDFLVDDFEEILHII